MNKTGNNNLAPQRQGLLREIVRQNGVIRVKELCRELGASPATVRRDLETLESQGKLQRVHGGAVSVESRLDEPLFDDKTSIASREKRRIAQTAGSLICPRDTVYLDGGSTVLELARLLSDRTDITVVTNSLRAAIELSGRGPRLILLGGELRRLSQTVVGALTRPVAESLHVNKAFMGTIGFSLDQGLTTTDPNEAFTKNLVASRADQVILLADGSKLGKVSFAKAGDAKDIDVIVTDRSADAAFLRKARKSGIRVIQA